MAANKGKKKIKVQDLKPKKDTKGGVIASPSPNVIAGPSPNVIAGPSGN